MRVQLYSHIIEKILDIGNIFLADSSFSHANMLSYWLGMLHALHVQINFFHFITYLPRFKTNIMIAYRLSTKRETTQNLFSSSNLNKIEKINRRFIAPIRINYEGSFIVV